MFFLAEFTIHNITQFSEFALNSIQKEYLYWNGSSDAHVYFTADKVTREVVSNAFRYKAIEKASRSCLVVSRVVDIMSEDSFPDENCTIIRDGFSIHIEKINFFDLTPGSDQSLLANTSREKHNETELIYPMIDLSSKLIRK